MRAALTFHVQGGSQIDHIFANRTAYDQAFCFNVARHKEFKSHSVLSMQRQTRKAEQMRRAVRKVSYLPQLELPKPHQAHLRSHLGFAFQGALQACDVDNAYDLCGAVRPRDC